MPNRVVVVDDDKEVQEIITFALSRNGFEVVVASNGQQLQDVLATTTPDLIILDVMMPGLDGYQIFGSLRKNAATQHVPVIIMTAHVENIYARISLDLGAAVHIIKPFHPLDLVGKVQRLLRAVPQD
jgi:two-component system, OmpR family, response regulator